MREVIAMSEYDEFAAEKKQIDEYMDKGYSIIGVKEDLNGDWLELEAPADSAGETVTLHIGTANARKYWTTLLMKP